MYAYFLYLVYVGAVIGICVLLLRRDRRRQDARKMPTAEEAALLRGGPGALMETVIFKLHKQGIIELKTEGTSKKLLAVISREQQAALSLEEEAVIHSFAAIQGTLSSLQNIRSRLLNNLREMEDSMQKAGWWKTPARWHWILTVLAPSFVAAGSLRFIDYYDGTMKWILALTVPFFAVVSRRIVLREMSGPTGAGKALLKKLQEEKNKDLDPVWQVALYGTQALQDHANYRLFYFMTRSIPYRYL